MRQFLLLNLRREEPHHVALLSGPMNACILSRGSLSRIKTCEVLEDKIRPNQGATHAYLRT